jgi:hypothetical protein
MYTTLALILKRAVARLGVLSCLLFSQSAAASEGGAAHYMPGALATLIDLFPTQPGWVAEAIYLNYEADTPSLKVLPVAGIKTLGLEIDMDAMILGGFYTFEEQVLGAHFSIGAMLPYIWMTAEGEIETVIGDRKVRDSEQGFGDITLIPAMLAWRNGPWQYDLGLMLYAPTGEYDVGRLANPGLNYWSINPVGGVAYNNPETGFNAALHGGFMFNTENQDTDYESGTLFHLDGSIQQLLPAGKGFLSLGLEGFWLQQVSADSGQRPILGDFKGRSAGIGPVLGYLLPMGDENFVAELRWLPELETKNRVEGDYIWLKLVYQF